MSAQPIYDRIGRTYAATRSPDPRIAARILAALGDAQSVVNVGAGTGSYEPSDRFVVGVEPSATMIRQRARGAAPAVRARAEALPFADDAFDAALATLTVHHWADPARGFSEMRRVARGPVVVLTWDQDVFESFWLVEEYLPGIRAVDRPRAWSVADVASALGRSEVLPVPIPHDCVDGFLGAFWRRPGAYFDPQIRSGISACVDLPEDESVAGLGRLAADMEDGTWADRHRSLAELDELDLGYRLIVSR